MTNGKFWHVLAVGLRPGFAPPKGPSFGPVEGQETVPEIARRAREASAFIAIAQPWWSGPTLEDSPTLAPAAHALEAGNHGRAVGCDRPDRFCTIDLLLTDGRRRDLCATDDARFGDCVAVRAKENEAEAVLGALKAGACYASQGPRIRSIEVEGDRMRVRCPAVSSIIVQGAGTAARALQGASLLAGEMALAGFAASPWIKVRVVDRAGRRARSNPL